MIIWAHQQMGDHVLCNGMYRCLADRFGSIQVACIEQNIANVRTMLASDSRISVVQFSDEPTIHRVLGGQPGEAVLRAGSHSHQPFDRWQFDMEFYRHAGVPFENRWTRCFMPPVAQIEPPQGDYIFVHDRPEMGAKIMANGAVERPRQGQSIFAHRKLIMSAREIHCVSSSFAVFADSFDLKEKPFHFYPFGREIPVNQNAWTLHE